MSSLSQTQKTIIFITISSALCGAIFAARDFFGEWPRDPISILAYWPFWLQGAIFGFAFSVVNLKGTRRISIHTLCSSVICVLAAEIFFNIVDTAWELFIRPSLAGLLAGAFGAAATGALTNILLASPVRVRNEAILGLIGGLVGAPFFLIIFQGELSLFHTSEESTMYIPTSVFFAFIAFLVWQIPVSWRLTTMLQNPSGANNSISRT